MSIVPSRGSTLESIAGRTWRSRLTTVDIVGREREIGEVELLLERAVAAPARLALVGEPGIGKTTIWEAGVRAASERGLRVYGLAPYWVSGPGPAGLVFGYGSLTRKEVVEGIDLLAEVISDLRG